MHVGIRPVRAGERVAGPNAVEQRMADARGQTWNLARAGVGRSVRFLDPRTRRACLRGGVDAVEQLIDAPACELDVGVDDEEVVVSDCTGATALRQRRCCRVDGGPVADVSPGGEKLDVVVRRSCALRHPIGGAVVCADEVDRLCRRGVQRGNEVRQVLAGRVGHRDHGQRRARCRCVGKVCVHNGWDHTHQNGRNRCTAQRASGSGAGMSYTSPRD